MKYIVPSIFALIAAFNAQTVEARPRAQVPQVFGYTGSQNYFGSNLNFSEPSQKSLREIRDIVSGQIAGEMIDAKLIDEGGRKVYEVRWAPSDAQLRGRIIIFIVDADSGQILSRRGG